VDLRRRLGRGGLAVLGSFDFSDTWGRVRQNYFASSNTSAAGPPQSAVNTLSNSDSVPALTLRLGLQYHPLTYPNLRLFAGYQFDYWWNTGRADTFGTFGYFFDSGVVLQAALNY
jgi:hypothetical protein